ncbi:MAG: hypothetical protein QM778_24615 [Myxococcales bacterium]
MVGWLLTACGDSGDTPTPESYVGEMTSQLVKAGEAAEVSLGAAKLKIPAGALDQDTQIELKVVSKKDLPSSKEIAIDAYDFGPDGLSFKAPAELEFDVSKVTVPADKRVDVAVLDKESNTWQALPNPKGKDGKISAEVAHFSLYTVILNPKNAPAPGSCGADFVACGGDVVGSWAFKTGCISAPPEALGVTLPSEVASCSMKPVPVVAIGVTGNTTFGADLSYSIEQMVTLNPSLQIPASCLDELSAKQGSPVTCADLGGIPMGELCVRNLTPETTPETGMGTYTLQGAMLQLTEAGGSAPSEVLSYCVQGNTLTVRRERPEQQRVDVYTAERQ